MKFDQYTEGNRLAWNETNKYHRDAKDNYYKDKFKDPKFIVLDDFEKKKLHELGVTGKIVAQLCCNNGVELISITRLGAKEGVGFDIADAAISDAKNYAKIANVSCTFERTDVYTIPNKYYNYFDIVYISAGSLNWLPDINSFFAVINKLLKDGGVLFIYDIHPFSEVFASDDDKRYVKSHPYQIVKSYFNKEPQTQTTSLDYIGKKNYEAPTSYWFTHTLSVIINGCIGCGINILSLEEFPTDVSAVLAHLEKDELVPLSFCLIGKKLQP